MTAESLTLLQPGDLRAIRIVCATCQAALTIRLDQTVRVPRDCPVCNVEWQDAPSHGSSTAADEFARALKVWLATEREKTPPFSLYLEIVTPS